MREFYFMIIAMPFVICILAYVFPRVFSMYRATLGTLKEVETVVIDKFCYKRGVKSGSGELSVMHENNIYDVDIAYSYCLTYNKRDTIVVLYSPEFNVMFWKGRNNKVYWAFEVICCVLLIIFGTWSIWYYWKRLQKYKAEDPPFSSLSD